MKSFRNKGSYIKGATKILPGMIFTYDKVNYVNNYGVKFDSKLEFYFYHICTQSNLDFIFQNQYELQPEVKHKIQIEKKNKKGTYLTEVERTLLRPITITVDFVFKIKYTECIVDTKGFQTEVNKLRFKMLTYNRHHNIKRHESQGQAYNYEIILISNKKEANVLLERLKSLS